MSKQSEINFNKRVHLSDIRVPSNTIRINTHNGYKHELAKAIVVFVLKSRNIECYSEVSWGNGFRGIADIYVPEWPGYIEILNSETDAMLRKKCEKYPSITQFVIRISDLGEDQNTWMEKIKELLP